MGNAFVAGLKNEAPRGRDTTNEDRNSEVSHICYNTEFCHSTQRLWAYYYYYYYYYKSDLVTLH